MLLLLLPLLLLPLLLLPLLLLLPWSLWCRSGRFAVLRCNTEFFAIIDSSPRDPTLPYHQPRSHPSLVSFLASLGTSSQREYQRVSDCRLALLRAQKSLPIRGQP